MLAALLGRLYGVQSSVTMWLLQKLRAIPMSLDDTLAARGVSVYACVEVVLPGPLATRLDRWLSHVAKEGAQRHVAILICTFTAIAAIS